MKTITIFTAIAALLLLGCTKEEADNALDRLLEPKIYMDFKDHPAVFGVLAPDYSDSEGKNIFIDLNNNNKKEPNEAIPKVSLQEYTAQRGGAIIYGQIVEVGLKSPLLTGVSVANAFVKHLSLLGNEALTKCNIINAEHLLTLDLSHCPKLTKFILPNAQRYISRLRRLDLTGSPLIEDLQENVLDRLPDCSKAKYKGSIKLSVPLDDLQKQALYEKGWEVIYN